MIHCGHRRRGSRVSYIKHVFPAYNCQVFSHHAITIAVQPQCLYVWNCTGIKPSSCKSLRPESHEWQMSVTFHEPHPASIDYTLLWSHRAQLKLLWQTPQSSRVVGQVVNNRPRSNGRSQPEAFVSVENAGVGVGPQQVASLSNNAKLSSIFILYLIHLLIFEASAEAMRVRIAVGGGFRQAVHARRSVAKMASILQRRKVLIAFETPHGKSCAVTNKLQSSFIS